MSKKKTLEERVAYLEKRIKDADFLVLAKENGEFKTKNRELEEENKKLKRKVEILKEGINATLTDNSNNYWRWYYTYEDELED
jgi:cell division protein FtsB